MTSTAERAVAEESGEYLKKNKKRLRLLGTGTAATDIITTTTVDEGGLASSRR